LALKDFEDPQERLLVIDEAHELDKYITSSLTDGISTYTLRVEIMERVLQFLPEANNVDVEGFLIGTSLGFLNQRSRCPCRTWDPT
jgi:ATP-dependent DNA helicase DinG